MSDAAITHLFVYGTLRPGDVRWHFLAPFVVDEGWSDTAAGSVYDTGLGYPAAIFDDGSDAPKTIHGRTYALLTASLDRCLAVLDHEEGTVGGNYRRVAITTRRSIRAWAYEYGVGLGLDADRDLIESGDWLDR